MKVNLEKFRGVVKDVYYNGNYLRIFITLKNKKKSHIHLQKNILGQ